MNASVGLCSANLPTQYTLSCRIVRWWCVPPLSHLLQVCLKWRCDLASHHTHVLLSRTDLAALLPYLSTAMRSIVCLVMKLPWEPIPEANTNPGRECSIFIGWDDSVFLIKYWLLVRLFQGNWCQRPSCCLRITWVLVSKANSGIPFSEILTLGVFWELAF